MEEKEVMKNKVVEKLLMFGVSSSVALSSSIGVAAAAMDNTEVEVIVENTEETTAEAEEESSETAETEDTETEEEAGETAETEDTVTEEEAGETAETEDTVTEETQTEETQTEETSRNVWVCFATEEGELLDDVACITLEAGDTYFNTSDVNVPEGYEVCNMGDVSVPADVDSVTISVRKVAATRIINVSLVTESGEVISANQQIEIGRTDTVFNTSLLAVPEGYELRQTGDVYIGDGDTLNVYVRKKEAEQKSIIVNYVLENDTNVGTGSVTVDGDANYINTSSLKDIPYGYELVNVGDIPFEGNSVNILVKEKEYTKDVIVNYVDEAENPVYTSSIKLSKDATYFNTSILKDVPYGWELVNIGDIAVNADNKVTVMVREKKYTKDVIINYVDEAGNPVYTSSIKLSKDATYFNTNILKDVPYGWVLASVGDIPVDENNTASVVVRQKKYTKDVIVNYVDEAGNPVYTSSIKLNEDATYFNTSILKDVPYGWELVNIGDITVDADNTATVVVREKEYTKDVIVNYVDEAGNPVYTSSIKLSKDATYFSTSILKDIPYGWVLVNVGDIPVDGNNTASVIVRQKKYTKDVIVNYVDEAGNPVYTSSIKLNEDATYFNTSILKDVPYGWELVNIGDITVDADNTATVVVREKEYTKDVIVNYVDEAGNPVYTSSIKLSKDATYFSTSILKDIPYGWVLVNVGDIPVDGNNTATVVVRQKKYTKNIEVQYVTKEGEVVATGSLTVDEDSTYINTSILKDVPSGYKIAIVGDLPIENNIAKVTVYKDVEDPEKPENPDKPTNPDKPINPDKPTNPEEPENPDNPTDPEEPENPDNPTDPEEPENPDNPTDPEEPENPDNPTDPEEPENPDNPTDPEEPENPDNPTDPEEPENPDNPTDPEEPGNPDNPTDPEKPEDSEQAGQSQKPGDNSELDKTESKPEIKTSNPKTGDPTSAFPLIAGLLSSGSIMGLVEIIRRKRK